MTNGTNIDSLAKGTTRRQVIVRVATAVGGLGLVSTEAWAENEEISRTAESIHQEVVFKASRKRVFEALTEAKQFDQIVQISGAVKSMSLGSKPTAISGKEGGIFVLFGGYITGRHIELVPNERIVQAWRVGSWKQGVYSIAKFELAESDSGTKIVFDHTGFPKGTGEGLAAGWKANYWKPLGKFLG